MKSFKRLLVVQDDSPQCDIWTKQAANLAKQWGADILGLYVEPEVIRRTYYDSAIGDNLEQVQNSLEDHRKKRLFQKFNETLKDFDIQSDWITARGDPIIEARRLARYTDLSVLGYPQNASHDLNNLRHIVEYVAVGSGCPTLVIPCVFSENVKMDKIAICWDGSREAVRALHDALELLAQARSVDVLIANENDASRPQISGEQLKKLLHTHAIETTVHELPLTHRNAGKDLLAKTTELGSQMIVLGAYGHSRLRDLILGGVTQHMLKHSTIPLFLSH